MSDLPVFPLAPEIWIALIALFAVLAVFSFVVLLKSQYKRCPSNQLLVIYGKTGKGEAARTIHGGASFVVPLLQNYAYLSLEPIQIEIPLRGALSTENIRVNVPSVFTVAIGTTPEVMTNAAIRLLDLTTNEIRKQAEEIIFGQLRQVIASMGIEDINRDRDTFLQHIQNSLEPELKKIGLVLINVNITDITDESGYIDAIGQKAASQAIQQARGDVADEEKRGEVRVAEAEKERAIQVAEATKLREIGTRGAERDQIVRVAELEKEQTVGERHAAFERDVQVKDAERGMRVGVADAEASAVDGENIAQARVATSNATLLVKKSEAYEQGEGRKREADANVLEVQNRAMARAALADADRVEAERRAEVEAPAKADKARAIVDAEATAERNRIEAEGEAAAIFAKLDAEARGQYEILAKKGDGLQRIIQAAGGSKEAFQLLMLEHIDKLAETSAKAIANIKFDKIVVWENGGGNGRTNTADFLHGLAGTLPPMLQVMKDVGGVDIPESMIRLAGSDDTAKVSKTDAAKPAPADQRASPAPGGQSPAAGSPPADAPG